MKKKSIVWGVVFVLAFGVAFESRAAPKEQPKAGGTLVFGLGKEFANPNPFVQASSTFQFVKAAAYESLLDRDEEERIIPNLAEKYEVSSGGTVFTLYLRKGVKFHNGKEMKADDVVWSANHVKEPKNGSFGNNMIKEVKSIEKVDDYAVKFTLPKPSAAFLSNLSNIRMLPIVPANSLKPGQMRLEKNAFVPGTGPFIFEQYQPGFDTVVKKCSDYWGGPAYLDKIMFRVISDSANRFNAPRTGDVQMADRLAPLDVNRAKKGEIKGIRILTEPVGGYSHLIVNYLNPLFQKLEMRQAFYYAVDKQRLVDEVFYGHARTTDTMMSPEGVWAKAANIPPQKRDVARAKALLKAAGYTGQELSIIERESEAQLLDALQRILGEAGIKLKVEIMEAGVMNEQEATGKYDMYVAGGNVTPDPVITLTPEYYTTVAEKGRYSNPKVNKLMEDLDREFDRKKRLQIFKDLSWLLYNDMADIPLFYEFRYVGLTENVRDYGPADESRYAENGTYFKRVWLK